MDLKQRKLNKSEWESIEISVSKQEIDILSMIMKGYHDVNIKVNNNNSLLTFLKIEYSEKMEDYLFNKYMRAASDRIEKGIKKVDPEYKNMKISSELKLNSADRIRVERFNEESIRENDIYEFVLLENIENLVTYKISKNEKQFNYYYYSLYMLSRNNIAKLNRHVRYLSSIVLDKFEEDVNKLVIIENAVEFIEKNKNLLKYGDLTLYQHQKDIFTACKSPNPKLILYMAPTGTGKTMTPIALSEQKKIIFVCAARHVGLALARAAISMKKKIAFAFGCGSASDVRLHYFAAKVYTINKRTGGIGKVDNSVGDNVQIMICDIKSYLPAMYYMLAHFKAKDIILYWDEPTITMDYDAHDFHATIRKNWKKNAIPNVVLSSATLPKMSELTETIPDFISQFPGAEICNIVSHDCKKSIPIVNKDGFVMLPHYLHEDYDKTIEVAKHCKDYLTLLRYFDLNEVVNFIGYVNNNGYGNAKTRVERHFETLNDIDMKNIKTYYVFLLSNIVKDKWSIIYNHFKIQRQPLILENTKIDAKGNKIVKARSIGPGTTVFRSGSSLQGSSLIKMASENPATKVEQVQGTSGVYVTTKDAYTLTDGPTIFISDDIEKIAKFCVQQANIPACIMDDIMKKIEYNNGINEKLYELETEVEALKEESERQVLNEVKSFSAGKKISGRNKTGKELKKFSRDVPDNVSRSGTGNINKLTEEINMLRGMIKTATLNDGFIPNKKMHLDKWAEGIAYNNVFTSNVDDNFVSDIMALKGVDNLWKVLLMMGIGVFINHENITYTEIMKKLADEQKLYMIIASSDYIYGTNYQFCHGFLSKDLKLTQEKVIQAMGRIGRNNIQQTYTVRFRDDEQIAKLFTSETEKPEIINMNKLFNTRKVVLENGIYVEVKDDLEDDFGNAAADEDIEDEEDDDDNDE